MSAPKMKPRSGGQAMKAKLGKVLAEGWVCGLTMAKKLQDEIDTFGFLSLCRENEGGTCISPHRCRRVAIVELREVKPAKKGKVKRGR